MRLFTHKGRKRRFSRGTATHRARAARASFVVGFRATISSVRNYQLSLLLGHHELSPPQPRRFLQGLAENEKLRTMEKALPVLHVNKLRFDVQHFPWIFSSVTFAGFFSLARPDSFARFRAKRGSRSFVPVVL